MKILFICGCLESGKDGVGDYTRRFSAELIKQGVSVGILAYKDKYVDNETEVLQHSEGLNIKCLRLPYKLKNKDRYRLAKKWIDFNNPEWLSLQFVPYSYNKKGIPFDLGRQLNDLGEERKWHIMIHELWIGMNKESSKKEIVVGYIQKAIISRLISVLKPVIIQTQSQLYEIQLRKLGFKASILPLFSNIPVTKFFVPDKMQDSNNVEIPKKYFVVFGSIHYGAPIENFVKELNDNSKNNLFSLVTIGRNGSELKNWIAVCKSSGFKIKCLGEQSLDTISYVLKNASFGMSTTPMALIEKSGSVAAMLEHNLPVICVSRPWRPRGIEDNWIKDGIIEYKFGEIEKCVNIKMGLNSQKNNIYNVALSFLEKINN